MQNNKSMKINLILIIILVNAQSLICQKIISISEIRFGDNYSAIKINQLVPSLQFSDFMPDDIEVDHLGNIFIVDKQNDRIIQFSSDLKVKNFLDLKKPLQKRMTPKLANRNIIENHLYNVKLEIDRQNNLYALVEVEELFLDLLKFDKTGEIVDVFKLNGGIPEQYLRDFFISQQNKIYINTLPVDILNIEYLKAGQVFVYNLNGDLIGRTDYFIEDNDGLALKRNLLNPDDLQIDFFLTTETVVKKTDNLEFKNSLSTPNLESKEWSFLGVDNRNMIYYFQGRMPIRIRRINPYLNVYDDIVLDDNFLKSQKILFKSEIKNVELNKSGEIILFGLKTNKPNYSCYDYFDSAEITGLIINIKF